MQQLHVLLSFSAIWKMRHSCTSPVLRRSLLCEFVLHPLLVFNLVSQAAELLLVGLPVVLQLLLQRLLEDGWKNIRDSPFKHVSFSFSGCRFRSPSCPRLHLVY